MNFTIITFYNRTKTLRACLVDHIGDYIEIGICITKNTKCCNVILIIIHLFGDKTMKIIE